jgi:hypothetical protein
MIIGLVLAAVVAGQIADEPAAKKPQPAPATKSVRTPLTKAQKKQRADDQARSVLKARNARRSATNKRRAVREAQDEVDYRQQLDDQAKAAKAQEDYVVKMGPIWAAEHANQIQQQRNALIAQRNLILKQQADYEAYLLYQLRASQAR